MLFCWEIDDIVGSLLFWLCVYIFGCELIVCDPMAFSKCNFHFISQKKPQKTEETKMMLKARKKKKKGEKIMKIKQKKKKQKKTRKKTPWLLLDTYVAWISFYVNSFPTRLIGIYLLYFEVRSIGELISFLVFWLITP